MQDFTESPISGSTKESALGEKKFTESLRLEAGPSNREDKHDSPKV